MKRGGLRDIDASENETGDDLEGSASKEFSGRPVKTDDEGESSETARILDAFRKHSEVLWRFIKH